MKKNPTVMIPVKRRVRPAEPVVPKLEANASVRESDRVFLTPRVINAQTYEEMSTDLRQLIDRAETMTETLQSVVKTAAETAGRMKKASRRYEERLNLGARLFETVCKRADEIEVMSKKFAEQTAQLEQLQESVDKQYEAFTQQIKTWEETTSVLDQRLNDLSSEIRTSAQPTLNELNGVLERASQASERARFAEKQASELRRQCDTVRQMMGEEMIAGAGLIDQLAIEQEQLRDVLDAGTILTDTLTKQSCKKQDAIEKCAAEQLRKIDHEAQRQTGKLLSMKSELVGLVVDLDQRTESLRDFMAQYEKLGVVTQSNIEYLKRWERYLPGDDDNGKPVSAALRDAVNQMRKIMDEEFGRLRNRLNRLVEAVAPMPENELESEHDNQNGNTMKCRNPTTIQIVNQSENTATC